MFGYSGLFVSARDAPLTMYCTRVYGTNRRGRVTGLIWPREGNQACIECDEAMRARSARTHTSLFESPTQKSAMGML